jgi:hypothetical protein
MKQPTRKHPFLIPMDDSSELSSREWKSQPSEKFIDRVFFNLIDWLNRKEHASFFTRTLLLKGKFNLDPMSPRPSIEHPVIREIIRQMQKFRTAVQLDPDKNLFSQQAYDAIIRARDAFDRREKLRDI